MFVAHWKLKSEGLVLSSGTTKPGMMLLVINSARDAINKELDWHTDEKINHPSFCIEISVERK